MSVMMQLLENERKCANEGFYGNILQVVSVNVHEPVIRLLLETGAEVNAVTATLCGPSLSTAMKLLFDYCSTAERKPLSRVNMTLAIKPQKKPG